MNTKPCYEAHITLDLGDRRRAQEIGDQHGWVFSEISGCPILGQGTYYYLTGYDTEAQLLRNELGIVAQVCRESGLTVLREKIEHIVYDTKTGRNEL